MAADLLSQPTFLIPPLAEQWLSSRDTTIHDEKEFVLKFLHLGEDYSDSGVVVKIHKYQVFRYAAALQHGANELMKLDLPRQGNGTLAAVIRDYGYAYSDYPSIWKLAITRCMLGYVSLVVAEYGNNTEGFANDLMHMIANDYQHSAQADPASSAVASAYRDQSEEAVRSLHLSDRRQSGNSNITTNSLDSNVIVSASPKSPAGEPNESTKETEHQKSTSSNDSISRISGAGANGRAGNNQARAPQQQPCAEVVTSQGRPKRPKSRSEKFCLTIKLFLCWLAKQPGGLDSLYESSLLEGRDVKGDCDPLVREQAEKATTRETWKPIGPTPGLHTKEIEMLNRAQMTVEQYNIQRKRITIGFAMIIEQNRLGTEQTAPINTGVAQAQILGSIDANKTSYIIRCFREFGWLTEKERNEWFPAGYRKKCIDALRTWVQGSEGKRACQDAAIEEDLVAPADD